MTNTPKLRFKEFKEEWEHKKLCDLADVLSGKRIPKGMNLVEYNTGIPYITVSDMGEQYVDTSNLKYITPDIEEHIKKYKVFKDDIIISVAGTLGKINLIQKDLENANLTENCDKITNLKGIKYQYLYYYLNTVNIQNQISSVNTISSQPKLALTCIRDFDINVPSYEEQEKIASFFSLIDKKIELQTEKVEELKKYKKGIMQKIFSVELRFKDDNGNEFPEWTEYRLSDIGVFYRGHSYNSEHVTNDGILVLRSNNIQENHINFTDLQFVSKQCKDDIKLIKNDIIICMANGSRNLVGKAAEYKGYNGARDITVGAFCSIFRTSNVLAKYIFQLSSYFRYLDILLSGTNINNLKNSQLESLSFRMPSCITETNKIDACLSIVDLKLDKEQEKLNLLIKYKKGLLQQMFI